MASSAVQSYHCICSELILATHRPLPSLPQRKLDDASICKISRLEDAVPGDAVLSGSTYNDNSATVLKLEDGFEKRYAARCMRCELQVGYWLDNSQFEAEGKGRREDVLYLLAGGLVGTEEMNEGKDAIGRGEGG